MIRYKNREAGNVDPDQDHWRVSTYYKYALLNRILTRNNKTQHGSLSMKHWGAKPCSTPTSTSCWPRSA